MARKMKDDQAAKPKSKAGSNGFDPAVLNSLAERIESIEADIESEKGASMQRCKAMKEDIADVVEEGKARGIPPKPFKKALKARKLNRQIEALRTDLADMIDQESYDQIRFALGDLADTPLGGAALKGKEPNGDDKDVRPDFLKNKGASVEASSERGKEILAGIKPLQ